MKIIDFKTYSLELTLLKMTDKALHNTNGPNYLAPHLYTVNTYNLNSLAAPRLEIPKDVGTLQDSAARSLNDLPATLVASAIITNLLN